MKAFLMGFAMVYLMISAPLLVEKIFKYKPLLNELWLVGLGGVCGVVFAAVSYLSFNK